MLDSKGFDHWAGDYDASIANSKGYPFDGYYNVLGFVNNMVKVNKDTKILDIGIGTGQLTYELYKKGAKIHGVDFSVRMLELAKEKMPGADFYRFDFNEGVPVDLYNQKFDYIVSSYAIHHIDNDAKANFILQLKDILKDQGKIIIADVAFETQEDHDDCKDLSGEEWDTDEIYFIGESILPKLREKGLEAEYVQISYCAGVLIVT